MFIDPESLDRSATYRLMISIIAPRPIAWMGTRGPDGVNNLAPFSYFMGVGSAPPLVAVSIVRRPGGVLKDSARNLLATGVLTIAIPERPLLVAMHRTGGPWSGSEFDAVGLEVAEGRTVAAPYVAQARVVMEGVVHSVVDLEQSHLFVIRITQFFVDDALWSNGTVGLADYEPIARLGGEEYAGLGEIVSLPPVRVG